MHAPDRVFSQTWGVTISASILQNELRRRLPDEFVNMFPEGVEIAYAAIPVIRDLKEPLKSEVRAAFAASLATVWKAMIGFSAAGFVTVFFMREVPMHKTTDETYGLRESGTGNGEKVADPEDGSPAKAAAVELTDA